MTHSLPEPNYDTIASRDYKITCRFCNKEDTWRVLVPPSLVIEARAEKAEAQRDALLEALKWIVKECKAHGRQHWPEAVRAQAAIAAVEGEKT